MAPLRTRVAPLVAETADERLCVPEVESLVPILALLRHAPALPDPTVRRYFSELSPGSLRSKALALVAWAGLESLLTPRVAPFLSLVDLQRKSWPPRWVNRDPSTAVDQAELLAGAVWPVTIDRRDNVEVRGAPLSAAGPASLATALAQRLSIRSPLSIARSPKSSDAGAERAGTAGRTMSSSTNDTLV